MDVFLGKCWTKGRIHLKEKKLYSIYYIVQSGTPLGVRTLCGGHHSLKGLTFIFPLSQESSDPSKPITTADIHQVFDNLAKKRKRNP